MIRDLVMMARRAAKIPQYKDVVYGTGKTEIDVTNKVSSGDIIVYIQAEYRRDVQLDNIPTGFTSLITGSQGLGAGTYEINLNMSYKVSDGTETTIDGENTTDSQYSALGLIFEGGTSVAGLGAETFTGTPNGVTVDASSETGATCVVGIKMETTNPNLTTTGLTKLTLNTQLNPEYDIGYVEYSAGNAVSKTMTSGDDGYGQWLIGFYIK